MPELPEVEYGRRQLARWSAGRPLDAAQVVDPAVVRRGLSTSPADAVDDPAAALAPLLGHVPGAPLRRGKRIAWPFGEAALLLHFGMTGKWVRRTPDDAPPRFGRLGLVFGDAVCWFVDPRRFGCVAPPAALAGWDAGLGPDALDACPDGPGLAEIFGGKRAIKVALLDQALLAGLGNIHAAEALWRAGVHPDRPGRTLTPAEWDRLAAAIPVQLRFGLDSFGGAEEVTYLSEGRGEAGDSGEDPNPFAVYGRDGGACPRCAGGIAHAVRAGRTTWWCPECQPMT